MFELGQKIWYIKNDRVHSAPVLSRMTVENMNEGMAHTKDQKMLYMPFGYTGTYYNTVHGVVSGQEVYGSKADIIKAVFDLEDD